MVKKSIVDYVISRYDAYVRVLTERAVERRNLVPNDIPANVYDEVAEELGELGTALHEELDLVTPEQFAEMHRMTVQTIRRWCRSGQLTYHEDARGMLIPRHAATPNIRGT
jgi:hypothetical protein